MHKLYVSNNFDKVRLIQYVLEFPPTPPKISFYSTKVTACGNFFFLGTCFGLHHSLSPFGFQWNYGCSSNMECGQLSSRYFSFHLDNILSKLGLRCAEFSLCFSWLLLCSTDASVFSSEVFLTLSWIEVMMLNTWKSLSLGFDENANRAPSAKGSRVLVQ